MAEKKEKKLLIVCPRFAPVNAADGQRARMMLASLQDLGWKVAVLALTPDPSEDLIEEDLERSIPDGVAVHYVPALPASLTRVIGIRGKSLRAILPLFFRGTEFLKTFKPNLVYCSTTMFLTFPIAWYWKKIFKIPYVLDLHDPWKNDYYSEHKKTPPGGRLRYNLAQLQARLLEGPCFRSASAITCVSDQYPKMIHSRYPAIPEKSLPVIPFAAHEEDFAIAKNTPLPDFFREDSQKIRIVYLGRLGVDMLSKLQSFFSALANIEASEQQSLELYFVGASYEVGGEVFSVTRLAQDAGVKASVFEKPERIPYFQALKVLQQADGVLLLGSEDESYSPSKIYPTLMSQKPVLALCSKDSPAGRILRDIPLVFFDTDHCLDFLNACAAKEERLSESFPDQYSSETMTKALSAIFEDCL